MIRYTSGDKAVALQILQVIFFLILAVFFIIIIGPVFTEISDVTHDTHEDTYYYEDAEGFLSIFGALTSTTGLLVVPVIMAVVFLLARAVYLTQFR